jgi:parallel beta-helix repeat protein
MLKYFKYTLIILIVIIACFLFIISLQNNSVSAKDIWVDDDYNFPDSANGDIFSPYVYIQDAIDAADDGDVIKVKRGTYNEPLYIDKSVSFQTDGIDVTFLLATTTREYAIDIAADSVYFTGFTINDTVTTSHRKALIHVSQGLEDVRLINTFINHSEGYAIKIDGASLAVIRNNTLNDTRGVYFLNSDLISFYDNKIWNCSNDGIRLFNSNDNTLGNNSIYYCDNGIYIQSGNNNRINDSLINYNLKTGIEVYDGTNNIIEDCTITNNNNIGIDVKTSNNKIFDNTLFENSIGIRLGNSGNKVYNCDIYLNSLYGLHCKPGSNANTIYNNTFTERYNIHALDDGSNFWDNEIIGNYWDDFYGPDPSNINNTIAYNIADVPEVYKYQKNGVDDWYPKGRYQSQPIITEHSPVDWIAYDGRNPPLYVKVVDPDPEPYKSRLTINYYYMSNNKSIKIGTRDNIISNSNVSMTPIKGYTYKGLGYDFLVAWYVEVIDAYSMITSDYWFFLTEKTPVDNIKPEISISADERFLEENHILAQVGDNIKFNASGCNDTDGKIVFYYWTFGDTQSSVNEISPTHKYLGAGNYICSLICVDDDGGSNMSTIEVKIEDNSNRNPVVYLQCPNTGTVDTNIQFNSIGTNDPDNDMINYTWNFGDGSLLYNQASAIHSYSSAGNYTVSLTVIDEFGAITVESKHILISQPVIDDTPGFEILIFLVAMIFVSVIIRHKKN